MENNLKDTIFENEENFNRCKEVLKDFLKIYSERDIEDFYSYTQTQILKYSIMSQQKEIASSIADCIMKFMSITRFLLSEYERSIKELQEHSNDVSIISKDFLLAEYKINFLNNLNKEQEEEIEVCERVFEDEEALQLIVTEKEQYNSFKERFEKHIKKLKKDKNKTTKELEEAKNNYSLGMFFDKNNEVYITDNDSLYNRLLDVYISMSLSMTYKNILDYSLKLFDIKNNIKAKKKHKEVENIYIYNMARTIEELLEVTEKNNYNFLENISIITAYKGLIDFKPKSLNIKEINKINIYSKENTDDFINKVVEEIMKKHQKEMAEHTISKGGAYVKRQ